MSVLRNCPNCGTELAPDSPAGLCPRCVMGLGLASDPWGKSPVAARSGPVATRTAVGGYGGFVPPPPQELASYFPQLEIVELIGQGGMGAVYKARQRGLDRLVALKVLPPQAALDPEFAERFAREARALARLSHPNIVGVYDSGRAGDFYYFLMEFVDGVNLRQAMRSGELSPREALAIVPQMCDALQYAHDEGVVHRDIKPENVLLDRKGRVKVADFGLAKLLGSDQTEATLTGTYQIMGTPRYMAPEQMEGSRQIDHRVDIFSLGVVFYELLTGELPLGRFPPPSKKAGVDRRLDEIVLRTLEKEPDERYQQASQLKTDVEQFGRDAAIPPRVFAVDAPARGGFGAVAPEQRVPPPGSAQPVTATPVEDGQEYRSSINLFGLPLVHIVSGRDRRTGKGRCARGVIAIGPRAVGGVAIGGVAVGGVALGGVALGGIAFGGVACGLLFSAGGVALAGIFSLGGVSLASHNIGGFAPRIVGLSSVRAPFVRWTSFMLGMPAVMGLVTAVIVMIALMSKRRRQPRLSFPSESYDFKKPTLTDSYQDGPRRRPVWPWLLLGLAIAPCFCLLPIGLFVPAYRSVGPSQAVVATLDSGSSLGVPGEWSWTAEGPQFSRMTLSFLNVGGQHGDTVQDVARKSWADYVAMEKQLWTQSLVGSHVVTKVRGIDPVVWERLTNRFWSDLDPLLTRDFQQRAREVIRLDASAAPNSYYSTEPREGDWLFGFGVQGGDVEIWRSGLWYHWKVTINRSPVLGTVERTGQGPELPPGLNRFAGKLISSPAGGEPERPAPPEPPAPPAPPEAPAVRDTDN